MFFNPIKPTMIENTAIIEIIMCFFAGEGPFQGMKGRLGKPSRVICFANTRPPPHPLLQNLFSKSGWRGFFCLCAWRWLSGMRLLRDEQARPLRVCALFSQN